MKNIFKYAILGIAMTLSVNFAWGQNNDNLTNGESQDCIEKVVFINLDVVGSHLDGWNRGLFWITFHQYGYDYTIGPGNLDCPGGNSENCCCYETGKIYGEYVGNFAPSCTVKVQLIDDFNAIIYTYVRTFPCTGCVIVIDGNDFPRPLIGVDIENNPIHNEY
jgi:hypothetical protein